MCYGDCFCWIVVVFGENEICFFFMWIVVVKGVGLM